MVAVKPAILPTPLPASPMEGVLFVQLYTIVPPVAVLLKAAAVVDPLLQTVWLVTVVTVAVGFTVIVKVEAVPIQVTPPLV